ncbi:MAG: hypothetical protein IJE73_05585 [Muribaculaceae bacterium]|nr:hypothetical protein [Muribaculaceae bacterium]
MKQRVELSTYSIIITILCLGILVSTIFMIPEIWWQTGWGGFIAILHIVCLYYMPLSIAADEHSIYINRSLKVKRIPIAEVKSVRLCPPTMGAIRVCGSGGYLGYWGWFKERDLGKYFAYYGKASDCFLVELSNGHKYMLGCQNAPEMVEYIAKQLKK